MMNFSFKNTRVSIHQPNFLPWLGFFNKLAKSDIFIIMDNVQFPKGSGKGNWTNRHYLIESKRKKWKSIPIKRNYHGLKNINEIEFVDYSKWKNNYFNQLALEYGDHPYFQEIMVFLENCFPKEAFFLNELNCQLIHSIVEKLGLGRTKIVNLSNIQTSTFGTELLCEATLAVGGDIYLSGDGSLDYLEPELFQKYNLQLEFQSFQHPRYAQFKQGDFISGLSIVDALMNCGFAGTGELVRS